MDLKSSVFLAIYSQCCAPTTPRLHGVIHHSMLTRTQGFGPKVVFCVGEKHGSEKCGDTDYITEYKKIILKNEGADNPKQLDWLIETGNYDIRLPQAAGDGWLSKLRFEFQDCYTTSIECPYVYTRFHWSDPLSHTVDDVWLDHVNSLKGSWKTLAEFSKAKPLIADHIREFHDLEKIILEDPHVQKEGKRSAIIEWENFVKLQLPNSLELYKKLNPYATHDTWWNWAIAITGRFKMDVYALLRMFRKDSQRFHNVVYHAGAFHTTNMTRMLRSPILKYDLVVEEGSSASNYKFGGARECSEDALSVDMNRFLENSSANIMNAKDRENLLYVFKHSVENDPLLPELNVLLKHKVVSQKTLAAVVKILHTILKGSSDDDVKTLYMSLRRSREVEVQYLLENVELGSRISQFLKQIQLPNPEHTYENHSTITSTLLNALSVDKTSLAHTVRTNDITILQRFRAYNELLEPQRRNMRQLYASLPTGLPHHSKIPGEDLENASLRTLRKDLGQTLHKNVSVWKVQYPPARIAAIRKQLEPEVKAEVEALEKNMDSVDSEKWFEKNIKTLNYYKRIDELSIPLSDHLANAILL